MKLKRIFIILTILFIFIAGIEVVGQLIVAKKFAYQLSLMPENEAIIVAFKKLNQQFPAQFSPIENPEVVAQIVYYINNATKELNFIESSIFYLYLHPQKEWTAKTFIILTIFYFIFYELYTGYLIDKEREKYLKIIIKRA